MADLNVPTSANHRKERLSVILFAAILAEFGLEMQQPEYEQTATDWIFYGLGYQDIVPWPCRQW